MTITRKLKTILFWILQLFGWGAYSLFLSFNIISPSNSPEKIYLKSITVLIGFLITLLLWRVNRRLIRLNISIHRLIFYAVLSLLIFALFWLILDITISYYLSSLVKLEKDFILLENINLIRRSIIWYLLMLTPWSLFYFLINFWIEWNIQKRIATENKELYNEAKLIMLRYQLNPHFFFNALNSINALIDENKDAAKDMIYRLSEFLRYSFLSDTNPSVKLGDEITIMQQYFDIEKVRFEDKIRINIDIDPKTTDIIVPGLILNPIVENAIKHGMKTTALPLRINVVTKKTFEGLLIQISNSGQWVGQDISFDDINNINGIGLRNVYNRLKETYGSDFKLNILTNNETVKVNIILKSPKLTKYD